MNRLLVLLFVVTNLYAAEPEFKTFKPIRTVTSKGILGDVESHLKADNPWTNGNTQIETSVHEGTHGLNSWARNGSTKYNGFYVLEDRYIQIWEPAITISDVKKNIPTSFRGHAYKYNLESWHTKDWENQPLYVIDEWIAYTNGCMYFDEQKELGKWSVAPTHAIDLTVFSFALLKSLPKDYEYKDELTDFIRWNTKRVLKLVPKSDVMIERWSMFEHGEDCVELKKLYDEVMR